MRLETNEITRKWAILHEGRKFHVKYSESDKPPSGLFNGKNWCVLEETDKETKELNVCVSHGDTPEHWKQTQKNALLKQKLVNFCMVNWENRFTRKIRKKKLKKAKSRSGATRAATMNPPSTATSRPGRTSQRFPPANRRWQAVAATSLPGRGRACLLLLRRRIQSQRRGSSSDSSQHQQRSMSVNCGGKGAGGQVSWTK